MASGSRSPAPGSAAKVSPGATKRSTPATITGAATRDVKDNSRKSLRPTSDSVGTGKPVAQGRWSSTGPPPATRNPVWSSRSRLVRTILVAVGLRQIQAPRTDEGIELAAQRGWQPHERRDVVAAPLEWLQPCREERLIFGTAHWPEAHFLQPSRHRRGAAVEVRIGDPELPPRLEDGARQRCRGWRTRQKLDDAEHRFVPAAHLFEPKDG